MKRLIALALIAFVIATALPPLAASAQGSGVIEGSVVNGTAGGGSTAGVALSLKTLRNNQETGQRLAAADAQGRFRFEDLDTSADLRYVVAAGYQNVAYNSQPIDLSPGRATVEIKVYETTTSDAQVSVSLAQVEILDVDGASGVIAVFQSLTFLNAGNRTYVGDLFTNPQNGGTVKFPLPGNAFDPVPGHGFLPDGAVVTPGGLAAKTPVQPGEQRFVLAYGIPYSDTAAAFDAAFAYTAQTVGVLMPLEFGAIASDDLSDLGRVDRNGKTYNLLARLNVEPGTLLRLELSGLPRFAPARKSDSDLDVILRYLGVALMVILAGGIVYYTSILRKRQPALAGGPSRGAASLQREREELVAAIARLDDMLAAGKIERAEHEDQRAAMKRRLLDIALLLKEQEAAAGQ
jgi:hypothetical protein